MRSAAALVSDVLGLFANVGVLLVLAVVSSCGSGETVPASGIDAVPGPGTVVDGGKGAISGSAGSNLGDDGLGGEHGSPSDYPDANVSAEGSVSSEPPIPKYPIKHVVIIVKENHTFDNYFGSFPGAEGTTSCMTSRGAIQCPHAPDRTSRDLCHEHSCALTDWNGGGMNGWDNTTGSSILGDNLAYAQYHESDIPNYWAYARKYTLADHFFGNVLGPSFPGHLFVLAAQAGWAQSNPDTQPTHPYWGCDQAPHTKIATEYSSPNSCVQKNVFPCFDIPSVPDILPPGVDWKFYGTNFYVFPEIWSMFNAVKKIRNGPLWNNVVNASQFEKDIESKRLPAVTWLVDQDFNSEHPLFGSVCDGENWTVKKVNKLMESDYWKDTAILFTMDDFGGWYDHVPPPRQYGCDSAHPYGLGFRLPLIIMSPYAKPGHVYKNVAEQASIPRFIERIFGAKQTLHSLDPAAQDEQANDLLDAFDFNQQPLSPLVLPTRKCR